MAYSDAKWSGSTLFANAGHIWVQQDRDYDTFSHVWMICFQLNNWISKTGNEDDTGFLQWKPVCYQKPERKRSVATSMKHYGIMGLDGHKEGLLNNTVLFGFYGYRLPEVTRNTMNFSFGIGKDGGYNKTQYLSW